MLIPFLMIWTGKESDDFGRSPFSIRNVANRKIVKKKPTWDTFLLEIFNVNKKMHFFGGLPYPRQGKFYDSAPTGSTKPTP